MSRTHAAAAAVYYVDSVAGNDKNSGTSPGSPWRTLTKVSGCGVTDVTCAFKPGDTILLKRGGKFNSGLTVPSSGQSGAPLTFADYGTGAKPIINVPNRRGTFGIHLVGKSYITLRNIVVTGGERSFLLEASSHHNILDTVEASGARYDGIALFDAGTSYNQILNSSSHDNGSTWSGIFMYCVNADQTRCDSASHNTVSGGTYYNVPGTYSACIEIDTAWNIVDGVTAHDCFYGLKTLGSGSHDNVFRNSTVYHNGLGSTTGFGIDVDSTGPCAYGCPPGGGNIVEHNVVYNGSSHGIAIEDACGPPNQPCTQQAIVRRNIVHDDAPNHAGIELDTTPDTLVYDNVVYHETEGIWVLNAVGASVYNNTIYGSTYGIAGQNSTGAILVKNNISSGNANAVWVDATSSAGWVSDYNDWNGPVVGVPVGNDTHSISKDPQFVSTSSFNFHLTSSSPAIGAGVALPQVTTDLDGVARPSGGAPYTLGAYEYVAAPSISSFIATPSTIAPGQSATLSWSVSGSPGLTLSIDNGVGAVTSSSVLVYPDTTTAYTLTATNSAGTATAQATVTVTSSPAVAAAGNPAARTIARAW